MSSNLYYLSNSNSSAVKGNVPFILNRMKIDPSFRNPIQNKNTKRNTYSNIESPMSLTRVNTIIPKSKPLTKTNLKLLVSQKQGQTPGFRKRIITTISKGPYNNNIKHKAIDKTSKIRNLVAWFKQYTKIKNTQPPGIFTVDDVIGYSIQICIPYSSTPIKQQECNNVTEQTDQIVNDVDQKIKYDQISSNIPNFITSTETIHPRVEFTDYRLGQMRKESKAEPYIPQQILSQSEQNKKKIMNQQISSIQGYCASDLVSSF